MMFIIADNPHPNPNPPPLAGEGVRTDLCNSLPRLRGRAGVGAFHA
jgi:hypothetical protein